MHLVMQGEAGQRIQLQQASSDAPDTMEDEDSDTKSKDTIIPLASRTAEGLVYLAKVIKKVECSVFRTQAVTSDV